MTFSSFGATPRRTMEKECWTSSQDQTIQPVTLVSLVLTNANQDDESRKHHSDIDAAEA